MEGNRLMEPGSGACREPKIRILKPEEIPLYLETGRIAYRDHYCHLWPGGDPWPYLSRNFTQEILKAEINNPNLRLWLIRCGATAAGICKLDLQKEGPGICPGTAVFIEKIYFKKSFTGKGLGSKTLAEISELAESLGRKFLWLEAMQKGPALSFYLQHGFRILGETEVPHPEVLPAEKKMWVLGRQL